MPPSGEVSMVDARDAYLAADMAEFGGANQDILWNVFAKRGLGEDALSAGVNDPDPQPGCEPPRPRIASRPDCDEGSTQGDNVRAAELQVFEH